METQGIVDAIQLVAKIEAIACLAILLFIGITAANITACLSRIATALERRTKQDEEPHE